MTTSRSQVAVSPRPSERAAGTNPRMILAIMSLAGFAANMDVLIVNVAFEKIADTFHGASISDVSWVLDAYAIIFAALLVPLGRLADKVGRKTVFLLGVGVFTGASVACAVAPGLWWLVAFRVLQAAGAAALTPTSLGLLLAATPTDKRQGYVRIWSAVGGLASAGGPVIGGLLVTVDWRLAFLVNLPIGVVAILGARRWVPDSRDTRVTKVPDLAGAAMMTVGIGALALAIVEGGDWGWGSGKTIAAFVVAAALTAGFIHRTEHHPRPIIEPDLYRVRTFAWANVGMVAVAMGMAAYVLMIILWMQNVWHWSIIATGFAVAPGPAMVPLVTVLAQRLAKRVPAGLLSAAGCLAFAASSVITLLLIGPHGAQYATELLPGQLLAGIGIGLALPTLLSSATHDLPSHRTSTGGGVINMTRQLGFVLAVSVTVAIIGTPTTYSAAHRVFVHGWWVIAGIEIVGALACLGLLTGRTNARLT
jgi:EmrB/QacA subfamily drug resistance transporter